MKMSFKHSERHDAPVVFVENWHSVVEEVETVEDLTEFYKEEVIRVSPSAYTLYDFIGMALHSQQQGCSELFYKGMPVSVENENDTGGGAVEQTTVLIIATVRTPMFLLSENNVIEV
jgi:hypothetical protein